MEILKPLKAHNGNDSHQTREMHSSRCLLQVLWQLSRKQKALYLQQRKVDALLRNSAAGCIRFLTPEAFVTVSPGGHGSFTSCCSKRVPCGRAVKSAAPCARGGQKFSIVIPPGRVFVSVSGCCNFENFSGVLRLGCRKITRRESTIRAQNISPRALTGSDFSVFIERVMTGGGRGGQGKLLAEGDTVPQIF